MPFVRITLQTGKTPEFRRAVADAVHQALVDVFLIPELDRFQVIEEHAPGNVIFPPEYFGIPHTESIVYIQITAKGGRTVDQKRRLYAQIASDIKERTDHSPDDVVIVLTENTVENWSFGRGEAQMVPAASHPFTLS